MLYTLLLAWILAAVPPAPIQLVPIHSIRVGSGDLKSVRISPDGSRAYVNNLEGSCTLVYDTRSYKLLRTIKHVGKPVETAFTDGGRHVWISYLRLLLPGYPRQVPDETKYRHASQVVVYDVPSKRIVARIPVGIMPKFIAVSPDERVVAVSNWISDTVSLIDPARNQVTATVKVGHVPRGLAFTPDGSSLYVANFRGESVMRIDMRTRSVARTIEHVGDQPRHIVMAPDGRTLYLSTNRDGKVHRYEVGGEQGERLTGSVFTGKETRTIALTADGRYLFAASFETGSLVTIDTRTMKVVSRTPVGYGAVGLDLSPDGTTLWVVTQPTRTIRVFRIHRPPVPLTPPVATG